ncbi:MAG: ribosomal protein S18-alanine N-acetyltransferase [Clostridium perfringens]|nr:ribosomal protein S18-alanine N-acetyltransferase [Clostridium perfringens]
MEIKIESMTLNHIDDVVEISKESFPISWSKDSFINEIKNPLAHYLVAMTDDRVIGFVGVWIIVGEANITNIAVSNSFRGKGIGNLLMENIMKLCKENDTKDMNLEVRASNIKAQNLYEKFGFIKESVRKKYYEDNKEDAIIMFNHNI